MKKAFFFLILSCIYNQLEAQEKVTRISHSGDIYDIYANEQIGKKITPFLLVDKNGKEVNSVELRKKPLVFVFWNLTVCDDCKTQAETVDSLYLNCLSKDVSLLSFVPNNIISLFEFEQNIKNITFPIIPNADKYAFPYGGLLGSPRIYVMNENHIITNIIAESTMELCCKAVKTLIEKM